MDLSEFTAALDEGVRGARGNGTSAALAARHDEVEALLTGMRDALRQYMGHEDAAEIAPWFSTNEGDGRKLVVRAGNGYEVTLVRFSIPLGGYPVTVRAGNGTFTANDSRQLRDVLAETLRDPDVASVVDQVMGM